MHKRAVLVIVTLVVSAIAATPGVAAADPVGDHTTNAQQSAAVTAAASGANSDAVGADSTGNHTEDWCEPVAGGEQRENPDEDTLGWENGCWYDDPLNIDRSDGLNDTELDAVVARSMARVEYVRELEFEENIPVEVISREEFANETQSTTYPETYRMQENVKWEAMFVFTEEQPALKNKDRFFSGSVLGYYSPSEKRIVIVSEDTETPNMDEITLAQELFHALQDQKFNLSAYDYSTRESHNANDGIVEGDGNYVDYLYEQECNENWSCLMPRGGSGGGRSAGFNWALQATVIQPYSDGPKFVAQIHRNQGWEAVNEVYENPPASTEQTIHPEKYGEDPPANMTFEDRSTDEWSVLEVSDKNYVSMGEAGLFVMLWYPSERSTGQKEVIPNSIYYSGSNAGPGGFRSFDHLFTSGWDGDRLYPYVNGSSFETNETGYVWKTVWDTEEDAKQFKQGYELLLSQYDAQPVENRLNTYVISEFNDFSDAYYVERTGKTVYIVNAPSVEDLSEVRQGAAPEGTPTPEPTATPTATPEPTDTDTPTSTDTPESTDTATSAPTEATTEDTDAAGGAATTDASGPGFGALPALTALAALLAAVIARRR